MTTLASVLAEAVASDTIVVFRPVPGHGVNVFVGNDHGGMESHVARSVFTDEPVLAAMLGDMLAAPQMRPEPT